MLRGGLRLGAGSWGLGHCGRNAEKQARHQGSSEFHVSLLCCVGLWNALTDNPTILSNPLDISNLGFSFGWRSVFGCDSVAMKMKDFFVCMDTAFSGAC